VTRRTTFWTPVLLEAAYYFLYYRYVIVFTFRKLNAYLSRNLDQNMPNNSYFLKKSCKFSAASGASPPNLRWPPVAGASAPEFPRFYSCLLL